MRKLFAIEKRNLITFALLAFIFTLLFLYPTLKSGINFSHDITFHLSRIDGVLSAMRDGKFPLAIYPYKNYGYGYAGPLFYCDLFLFIPAILHRFGFTLVQCYKFVLWIFTFFGTFFVILVAYHITHKKDCAILSALLWTFSNYHFSNIFFRGALGEVMAATFLPLLIYLFYRIFVEKEVDIILLATTFSCLLFSHLITFALSVALFGVLLIIHFKELMNNKLIIVDIIKATTLAILLSAFFLLPMLEQFASNYFNFSKNMGTGLMEAESLSIKNFIGDVIFTKPTSEKEFSYGLGTLMVVFSLTSAPIILKGQNKLFKILIVIALVLMIYPLNILNPEKNILFSFIQFPWRVYQILSPLLAIMIGYAYSEITRGHKTLIILITLYMLLNHFVSVKTIEENTIVIPNEATYVELFDEQKYTKYSDGYLYNVAELSNAEYLPYTYDFSYIDNIGLIQFLNYDDTKITPEKSGTTLKFSSNLIWGDNVLLPLTYYKGYKAYEIDEQDNVIKELEIESHEYTDRIMIYVESGQRNYLVRYEGTLIQKLSTTISLISLFGIILWPIHKKRGVKNEKNIIRK